MLFDRGSRHKIYIETMERELKRLEDGDLAGIRFVYGAFATQDAELIRRAGEAARRQMSPMTDLQMLKLCQRFGTFTSLEWAIDWMTVSPDRIQRALPGEAYRYVLVLGSFHPNGYFREKCVYAMAGCQGMRTLAVLAFPADERLGGTGEGRCGGSTGRISGGLQRERADGKSSGI